MTPPASAPAFLNANGWPGATIAPLAGDASFRRYFRVTRGSDTAVLMDAPPAQEDSRPFVFMAAHLRARGFSAPALLAGDLQQGLLLIEDFGDRLMGPVLAAGAADETAVYGQAIDVLARLGTAPPPLELRPYDRAELLREVTIFAEYYAPAAGIAIDRAAYTAAWDAVWGDVLRQTADGAVLTLRDYHAENLMLLDRPGVAALGLLDFQDALAGHPAYDLVSLLQDARRDVAPALETAMIDRFVAAAGIDDALAFRAAYDVLGAQRNVKILGVFTRLRDRDGRSGYVQRLPRVWRYLARNLAHPALAPLRAWFDEHVAEDQRAGWCR
jgi:N-acetylmuramate 1-kinase